MEELETTYCLQIIYNFFMLVLNAMSTSQAQQIDKI